MANWLQKFLPPPPPKRNLPTVTRPGAVMPTGNRPAPQPEQLPNASVIYGAAAAVLIVVALYLCFRGRWVTGLLVLLPTACLVGFAMHFIKHPDA